jgi:hypothetical protein
MRSEIAAVRNPKKRSNRPRQSLTSQKRRSLLIPQEQEDSVTAEDEEWSSASASETEKPSPRFTSLASKSISRTPPSEPEVAAAASPVEHITEKEAIEPKEEEAPRRSMMPPPSRKERSPSPLPPTRTPSPQRPPKATESDLADEILNSMSAASPSPKKTRHTLSLAERTRLSMSRHPQSQHS